MRVLRHYQALTLAPSRWMASGLFDMQSSGSWFAPHCTLLRLGLCKPTKTWQGTSAAVILLWCRSASCRPIVVQKGEHTSSLTILDTALLAVCSACISGPT